MKSPAIGLRDSAQVVALAKGWDGFYDLATAALSEDRAVAGPSWALLRQIMATQPKALQQRDFEALVALAANARDLEVSESAYYQLLKQRIHVKSPVAKAALMKIRQSPDPTCAHLANGLLAPESWLGSLFSELHQKRKLPIDIREATRKIDEYSRLPDPVSKMSADEMVEYMVQLEERLRKLDKAISAHKAQLQKWGKKPPIATWP